MKIEWFDTFDLKNAWTINPLFTVLLIFDFGQAI